MIAPSGNAAFSWLRCGLALPEDEEVRADVVRIAADDGTSSASVGLMPSPSMRGYPMQRVLQVCLGSEHGVLVTHAGICFTFGDNRYGQLGRSPCKLSENSEPFPVLDLVEHEIVQVAAGTHHCLALTADKFVWAWGRNKVGQCGCQETRDKTEPVRVHDPRHHAKPLERVTTISAGGNSSVAATVDSEILQWGEISRDFTYTPKDQASASTIPGGMTQKEKAFPVEKKLPFCVFHKEDFQKKSRKGRVSVSESGLRVLLSMKAMEKEQVSDAFKTARKWRKSILQSRRELKELTEKQAGKGDEEELDGVGGVSDMNEMHDAIGLMQRELKMIDREIYLLERNMETCELQQKHLRDQIQGLAGQGVRLHAKENQISMNFYEAKGGDRNLEKEMTDIKGLIEANHNTRTTLLEQRAHTDKEKQRVEEELKDKRRLRDQQHKRLARIQELHHSVDLHANSDSVMDVARELSATLETLPKADARGGPSDFPGAMAALEAEDEQLATVEARLREFAESRTEPERAERARQVTGILQSLVDSHRQRNNLLSNCWLGDDLDLSCFFEQATSLPPLRTWAQEKASQAPAKLWAFASEEAAFANAWLTGTPGDGPGR